jgi:hypothetical protein
LEKIILKTCKKLRITKEQRKARPKEEKEAGTLGQVEACARPAGPNLLFFGMVEAGSEIWQPHI